VVLGLPALPALATDLKIATVMPDNSAWMVALRHGGEEIRQRTAGRVNLRFYGGGVMGNDSSVLRKIRIGQLQGGAFTAGGLSAVCPELGLYSFPLLFRSTAEIDFVRLRRDPAMAGQDREPGQATAGRGTLRRPTVRSDPSGPGGVPRPHRRVDSFSLTSEPRLPNRFSNTIIISP